MNIIYSRHILFTLALLGSISFNLAAKGMLQGTISFLNSGSRPAVGVKISAFGANSVYSTESGMFILEFPDKQPGDKVKIMVGATDQMGTSLELVNNKVLDQVRIPSKPDDDIIEIIVCKLGQRNEAALRYNDIIVKSINESTEKRLRAIDEKLAASKIDTETIVSLQKEKEKLKAERDSALSTAEEQALFMASINLDRANQMVKQAIDKMDSSSDIAGAIAVLDNELLLQAYGNAKVKIQKGKAEINQVIEGYKLKINLLSACFQNEEVNKCCSELEKICYEQNCEMSEVDNCFTWAVLLPNEKSKKSNRLIQTNLRDGQEILQSMIAHYEGGQYEKAIEGLGAFLNDHPENDTAQYYLGLAYMNISEYKKTINLFSQLTKDSSRFENDALWYLGLCYLQLGNGQEDAREAFTKLSNNNNYSNHKGAKEILDKLFPDNNISNKYKPENELTYDSLALIYATQKNYSKQLEFNLKALAAREKKLPAGHPDLAVSYNDIASTYIALGDYNNAIKYTQEAIFIGESSNPKHRLLNRFYTNLGISFVKTGQFDHANEAFEKSESIRADEAVYRGWAIFYALQKKRKQSVMALQKAAALGFRDLEWIETEPDLNNIREEKGYKDLVEKLKKR